MPDNKTDLMKFLSKDALEYNFKGTLVIVNDGFEDPSHVKTTTLNFNVGHLVSMCKEAGTRIVLYVVHNKANNVVCFAFYGKTKCF